MMSGRWKIEQCISCQTKEDFLLLKGNWASYSGIVFGEFNPSLSTKDRIRALKQWSHPWSHQNIEQSRNDSVIHGHLSESCHQQELRNLCLQISPLTDSVCHSHICIGISVDHYCQGLRLSPYSIWSLQKPSLTLAGTKWTHENSSFSGECPTVLPTLEFIALGLWGYPGLILLHLILLLVVTQRSSGL